MYNIENRQKSEELREYSNETLASYQSLSKASKKRISLFKLIIKMTNEFQAIKFRMLNTLTHNEIRIPNTSFEK
jgi:hypothetical protein